MALFLLFSFPARANAEVKVSHLYNLANFEGIVPYSWVNMFVDKGRNEVYVSASNIVRIFNDSGMEVHRFGQDSSQVGVIVDVAVDESGSIYLLSYVENIYTVHRCNFRGDLKDKVSVSGLPEELGDFAPDRIFYREGNLYLVGSGQMRVVVVGTDGRFREWLDLAELIEVPEKERRDTEISGFTMDDEGNMLFTVNVLFSAYKVFPDKKFTRFGTKGSAPGRFSNISGIAADKYGHILVADSLRSVVLVFSKALEFLTEFGYRGSKPENLFGPKRIATDNAGRVYISQTRELGVSVFSVGNN